MVELSFVCGIQALVGIRESIEQEVSNTILLLAPWSLGGPAVLTESVMCSQGPMGPSGNTGIEVCERKIIK